MHARSKSVKVILSISFQSTVSIIQFPTEDVSNKDKIRDI